MKPLKPSMKEKKRYLLVRGKNLKTNVEKAVLNFIGVLGMSKAGLRFIRVKSGSAIVSVNRQSLSKIRASLGIWPEKIEVLKVSGTLKGLE